jgi:hypothetical protein
VNLLCYVLFTFSAYLDHWVLEYIEERLNDQIIWYSKKSQTNQKWFKRLRLLEIIVAAISTVNILLEIDVSRVLKFPQ